MRWRMASTIKVDNGVLRNLVKYERPHYDVTGRALRQKALLRHRDAVLQKCATCYSPLTHLSTTSSPPNKRKRSTNHIAMFTVHVQ
jgi:hypothetical protein